MEEADVKKNLIIWIVMVNFVVNIENLIFFLTFLILFQR